jgi:hypothetical protein
MRRMGFVVGRLAFRAAVLTREATEERFARRVAVREGEAGIIIVDVSGGCSCCCSVEVIGGSLASALLWCGRCGAQSWLRIEVE